MNELNLKSTPKQFVGMLLGNIILGLGIAIFKFSGLGNDPFSAMMMGLADLTPISYALLTALLNTLIFLVELIFGRHYIGFGTLVNWVLLAYFVTFFYNTLTSFVAAPDQLPIQFICMILGVIVVSFGVSLYQASDSGVAPYDSVSIIMADRLPVPYFFCRLATDIVCAGVCFLAGGLLGIGTIVCALCLGPFVHFFNQKITYRVMDYKENSK